jgi:hypothetical protein
MSDHAIPTHLRKRSEITLPGIETSRRHEVSEVRNTGEQAHDRPMPPEIQIDPPIVVSEKPGASFNLSTVEQVIDYVRRHRDGRNWNELRDAAFVAAAVPSEENLATLRELAARAFKALR